MFITLTGRRRGHSWIRPSVRCLLLAGSLYPRVPSIIDTECKEGFWPDHSRQHTDFWHSNKRACRWPAMPSPSTADQLGASGALALCQTPSCTALRALDLASYFDSPVALLIEVDVCDRTVGQVRGIWVRNFGDVRRCRQETWWVTHSNNLNLDLILNKTVFWLTSLCELFLEYSRYILVCIVQNIGWLSKNGSRDVGEVLRAVSEKCRTPTTWVRVSE